MSPTPEYRTLHGTLTDNNRMTGILGIGGGTANYENLINKPSINNVTLTGNLNTDDLGLVAPSDLSEVAFSGDYDDLTDKPSIPSKVSDLTNDSGFITMEDMTASNVEYNNTTSGISSDDVQSALDNIINAVRNAVIIATATGNPATFTTDMTEKFLSLSVDVTATQAGSGTPATDNVRDISGWSQAQITVSNGVTPQNVTITFDQTVYFGILDLMNGSLTITHRFDEFDGSDDESWTLYSEDTNIITFRAILGSLIKSYNNSGNGIYNYAVYGNNYQSGKIVCRGSIVNNSNNFFILYAKNLNLGITDLASWKTYLSNNHFQAVNELATHVTVSFDPVIFNPISGTINITSTTGNVTVKYLKSVGGELT